jgi:predicted DNA-binding protein YlxM (UPF0122 family)
MPMTLNRTKVRVVAKQHMVLKKYFENRFKPREISRQLKVPRQFVYKAVNDFKLKLRKVSPELQARMDERLRY